ncbi:MAG TPA: carboxypeptidase regulatory-like domain-containing protein [Bacteroidales bacterium]|nr:carboxypeptidase regulatory-like domain-containing protein [Bacteroidales bacterium]HPL05388.1 carboxypeptidase regulatory-like domain-containing protein [Bacteroidales bacterium]
MTKKFKILGLIAITMSVVFTACNKEPDLPGSISGVVSDKATGELIRSAVVRLQQDGTTYQTGNDGHFEIPELEAGLYTLSVSKTGYAELLNYNVMVESGKTTNVDVPIEKLPAALRIVDANGKNMTMLDFGSDDNVTERIFNIFNDSPETLEWMAEENCAWITSLSKTEGIIQAGQQTPIKITIDRSILAEGINNYVLNITSNNGSAELTVAATHEKHSIPYVYPVINIDENSATFQGYISQNGNLSYSERGFVYSLNSNPTIENCINKIVIAGTGPANKVFSYQVQGLQNNTTYFVRTYVKYGSYTFYSIESESFTTTTMLPYIIFADLNLMVQRYDICTGCFFNEAESLCNNSNVGGFTDWRLPNLEELRNIIIRSLSIGNFIGNEYWSSTERSSASCHMTIVNTDDFHYSVDYECEALLSVRAVRTLP